MSEWERESVFRKQKSQIPITINAGTNWQESKYNHRKQSIMHNPPCPLTAYSCFMIMFLIITLSTWVGTWAEWKAPRLCAALTQVSKAPLSFWKTHRKFPDWTSLGKSDSSSRGLIFRMPVATGWPWVDCFVFASGTGSGTTHVPHWRAASVVCSGRAVLTMT